MANKQDLVAAIMAQPDDELARRQYADWLVGIDSMQAIPTKEDEVRSEFINLQLRLSDPKTRAKDKKPLQKREAELIKAHGKQWQAEAGLDHPFIKNVTFKNGFIEGIEMNAMDFTEANMALVFSQLQTPLRDIKLVVPGRHMELIAGNPYLSRFTSLDLSGQKDGIYIDEIALQTLLSSKHLGRLKRLNLANSNSSEASWMINEITSCPALVGLEALDVSGNNFHSTQASNYSLLNKLSQLKTLNLKRCNIDLADLSEFLQAQQGCRLETLDLSGNQGMDEAARLLASSPRAQELHDLRLASYGLTSGGLNALAEGGTAADGMLKKLTSLDVSYQENITMSALTKCVEALPGLTHVNYAGSRAETQQSNVKSSKNPKRGHRSTTLTWGENLDQILASHDPERGK